MIVSLINLEHENHPPNPPLVNGGSIAWLPSLPRGEGAELVSSYLRFILYLLVILILASYPNTSYAQDLILRIPVTHEGIYRITYEYLGVYGQSYGIDPKNIIPSQIHVYNREKDVAIIVEGEEDGSFDAGDFVEFYGVPVRFGDPEYKYTDENVYWLKISSDPAVRMAGWDSSGAGVTQTSYLYSYHVESNWYYWETMPAGSGLDHWFWGERIKAGDSRSYGLRGVDLTNTDSSKPAEVRVYLHGKTDDPVAPDHTTKVSLNGTVLGEVQWDGQKPVTHSFKDVPANRINNGDNIVTFEETQNPDVTVDSIFVNWIEIDYYKKFIAEGNRIKFTAEGQGERNFSITGFSSPLIYVFDVSDPDKVRRLRNPIITSHSGGGYKAIFSDTISEKAAYLAISFPAIEENRFDFFTDSLSLKSADNGADYIIITHEEFRDAVLPLASHRESQGYRVKVVTTKEIYNEFSGGIFTPAAIKNFLKYAYENWKGEAPEFVVLIGDANIDYKDYWGTKQINYVPTYLIETALLGETPSDNWFVTVAGDDPLPDMFIGRIPAKSADEVKAVVNKIISYETGGQGSWQGRVLFAANDQDPRFDEYSEEWAGYVTAGYTSSKIYASKYTDKAQPRVDLINQLNNGVLLTSFFGHGSIDLWAVTGDIQELFTSDDASKLSNHGMYPFVVGFNCLNGFFAGPSEGTPIILPDGSSIYYSIPLSEAILMKEDKGAIAMWSPSAFAYPSEQRLIGHELFSGIFEKGNKILGSVTTAAKVNPFIKGEIYEENLDVFTFFGDPATKLALPVAGNDVKASDGGGKSGGGGCFIATAAFGSYLHPYVRILRDFRDDVLMQSASGRKFVSLYYRLSPPAAEWISQRPWARAVARVLLLPVILLAWLFITIPACLQAVFISLL